MGTDRLLKHAYLADRRLKPEVSWQLRLEHQLQGLLIPSPTEEQPHRRQFSLVSAQSQHIQQLSLETSSKSMTYHQTSWAMPVSRIYSRPTTATSGRSYHCPHTGRVPLASHRDRTPQKLAKQDRTCPMCFCKLTNPGIAPECWDAFDSDGESSSHIEDEHHAIFDCSGYTYARELFQGLFQSHITSITQFLNQPQCNRLAKFITWIRMMHMNKA